MQKWFWKKRINILTESTKFNTISQRLVNQARLIEKKNFLFDLEVLKMCGHLNRKKYMQKKAL